LEVDTRGDDLADGPPIEDWDEATRAQRLEESLKGVTTNGGRVGIFNVSHIGGERFYTVPSTTSTSSTPQSASLERAHPDSLPFVARQRHR
jgi:hypothetical protein